MRLSDVALVLGALGCVAGLAVVLSQRPEDPRFLRPVAARVEENMARLRRAPWWKRWWKVVRHRTGRRES